MVDTKENFIYSEKRLCSTAVYNETYRKSIFTLFNNVTDEILYTISFSTDKDYGYGKYIDGDVLDSVPVISNLLITKIESRTEITPESETNYEPYYELNIFIQTDNTSKKDLDVIKRIKSVKICVSEIEFDEKLECTHILDQKDRIVISLDVYGDMCQSIRSLFDFLEKWIKDYPENGIPPFITELDFYN